MKNNLRAAAAFGLGDDLVDRLPPDAQEYLQLHHSVMWLIAFDSVGVPLDDESLSDLYQASFAARMAMSRAFRVSNSVVPTVGEFRERGQTGVQTLREGLNDLSFPRGIPESIERILDRSAAIDATIFDGSNSTRWFHFGKDQLNHTVAVSILDAILALHIATARKDCTDEWVSSLIAFGDEWLNTMEARLPEVSTHLVIPRIGALGGESSDISANAGLTASAIYRAARLAFANDAVDLARSCLRLGMMWFPDDGPIRTLSSLMNHARARSVDVGTLSERLRASRAWLDAHRTEFAGMWVAVQDGVLLGAYDSVIELRSELAVTDSVLVTRA